MNYDVIHRSLRHRGRFAQGDIQSAMRALRSGDFDLVVQCAEEHVSDFSLLCEAEPPRCRLLQAPNDDGQPGTLTRKQITIAATAARQAATAYKRGERVLINCKAGRNRSGLVTAMALHLVSGISGAEAVRIVRERRNAPSGPALTNQDFVSFLSKIPAVNNKPQAHYFVPSAGAAR